MKAPLIKYVFQNNIAQIDPILTSFSHAALRFGKEEQQVAAPFSTLYLHASVWNTLVKKSNLELETQPRTGDGTGRLEERTFVAVVFLLRGCFIIGCGFILGFLFRILFFVGGSGLLWQAELKLPAARLRRQSLIQTPPISQPPPLVSSQRMVDPVWMMNILKQWWLHEPLCLLMAL